MEILLRSRLFYIFCIVLYQDVYQNVTLKCLIIFHLYIHLILVPLSFARGIYSENKLLNRI